MFPESQLECETRGRLREQRDRESPLALSINANPVVDVAPNDENIRDIHALVNVPVAQLDRAAVS
jgi:hypothetical protein